MDEVSAGERRYDTTQTIDINTLSDNFSVKDIKEINESELQNFLIGDPVPEVDADEDITRVQKKQPPKTEDEDDIPPVKKKKTPPPVDEDDIDDFLTKEKETKDTDTDKDRKKPSVDEENIFATLNRDLMKNGIFSEDEEEIKDAEGFKNRFVREMNKGAQNVLDQFLSQHGPEYRDAFESIFVNGVSPETYFKQIERIENLEDMDLKNVDNQERVLRNFYKSKGFSEEKVSKKIENLKNYGEIEEEAQAVHEILLKEETERLEEEREKATIESARRQQNKQHYRSTIQRILSDKIKAKSFDGIPLDQNVANKVYKQVTEDAWTLPDGRLITDFDKTIMELDKPENFEKKLKLALLLNNDLDLSIVKREAIRKETNEAFEGLQRRKAKKDIPSTDNMRSFF